MNSERLAEGARYKSRLMGPTLVAMGAAGVIVSSWGTGVDETRELSSTN